MFFLWRSGDPEHLKSTAPCNPPVIEHGIPGVGLDPLVTPESPLENHFIPWNPASPNRDLPKELPDLYHLHFAKTGGPSKEALVKWVLLDGRLLRCPLVYPMRHRKCEGPEPFRMTAVKETVDICFRGTWSAQRAVRFASGLNFARHMFVATTWCQVDQIKPASFWERPFQFSFHLSWKFSSISCLHFSATGLLREVLLPMSPLPVLALNMEFFLLLFHFQNLRVKMLRSADYPVVNCGGGFSWAVSLHFSNTSQLEIPCLVSYSCV